MDPLREFLETVRSQGAARGRFRGLLNVLIGRRISTAAGELLSAGMTWRELAALLKRLRWEPERVEELGVDPATLPPRDRQRFWYSAIGQCGVASPEAGAEGDAVVEALTKLGYIVGPAPGAPPPPKGKKRPPQGGRGPTAT
jgi:hypothetical protein